MPPRRLFARLTAVVTLLVTLTCPVTAQTPAALTRIDEARAQVVQDLAQLQGQVDTARAELVQARQQQQADAGRIHELELRVIALQAEIDRKKQVAIGVNIEAPMDWMRTWILIDVMKTARPFGKPDGPWGPREYLPLEPDGYPAAGPFASLVMSEQVGAGGWYTFICSGQAARISGVATRLAVRDLAYDAAANRTTAMIQIPDAGGTIRWEPAPGHRLTNLQLLRPGYTEQQNREQIWTTEFLRAIEPFGTIRAMDLVCSNESKVTSWDTRARLSDSTYHKTLGKGLPVELLIDLANRTGKPVWYCVPGGADEGYVRELAKVLKRDLLPTSVMYVEYSNEVWNTMFHQTKYNAEQAKVDPETAGLADWRRPHARVAKMIALVAKELEYPADPRFRPILGTQLSNFDGVTQPQLDFLNASRGGVARNVWAIAVAPYYNDGGAEFNRAKRGVTVEKYFEPVEQDPRGWLYWRVARTGEWVKKHVAAGKANNVLVICYEGGMDLGQFETQYPNPDDPRNFVTAADGTRTPVAWSKVMSWVNPTLEAKIALQRDPRMYDVTRTYLELMRKAGMAEVVYFTLCGRDTRFGFFGLTDDIRDLEHPKFRAARDVANSWKLN